MPIAVILGEFGVRKRAVGSDARRCWSETSCGADFELLARARLTRGHVSLFALERVFQGLLATPIFVMPKATQKAKGVRQGKFSLDDIFATGSRSKARILSDKEVLQQARDFLKEREDFDRGTSIQSLIFDIYSHTYSKGVACTS